MNAVVVGSAALQAGTLRADAVQPRMRSASLLKPLLFWAAARSPQFRGGSAQWAELAQPGVVLSDNDATVEVWSRCGGAWLLDELAPIAGIRWQVEAGGVRPFGRVRIQADEVARAYGRLAVLSAEGDRAAEQVLNWMQAVPAPLDFGVRAAAAGATGARPADVAVKTGWFCDIDETSLRTHAVTVTATAAGSAVTAVLTAVAIDADTRTDYAAAYRTGPEVVAIHQRFAGNLLASRTASLLLPA